MLKAEIRYTVANYGRDESKWGLFKHVIAGGQDVLYEMVAEFASESEAELFQRFLHNGGKITIHHDYQMMFEVE